jgi:hypothetical protein
MGTPAQGLQGDANIIMREVRVLTRGNRLVTDITTHSHSWTHQHKVSREADAKI